MTDQRVGLARPAEGVDLYICPSQGKAAQMLAVHMPKEHSGSSAVTRASVIGVVVWRRPHVSTKIPMRQSMSIPRKQQTASSCAGAMSMQRAEPAAPHFSHSNTSDNAAIPHWSQDRGPAISQPLDRVEEVVCKYSNMYASGWPWDDSDNDTWEWDRQPLLSPSEHFLQTQHYYHRHHHQQDQYDVMQEHIMVTPQLTSSVSQIYVRHVQLLHNRRRRMIHSSQAQSGQLGWWSDVWWHGPSAGIMRPPWFGAEPDMVMPNQRCWEWEPWPGSHWPQ